MGPPAAGSEADPYLDYARSLTDEGGIHFVYKDIDDRLRHILWAIAAWVAFSWAEGWLLLDHSPIQGLGTNIACLLAVLILNAIIVGKPVEIYCQIEIRPDCMILGDHEVFWASHMEQWPSFHADAEGNQVLSGIYGTRQVEFFTVRRFDEFDRAPEVFAVHLQQAMKQLWTSET